MTVLVVGSGGREHVICAKLARSPLVTKLFCAPGNGGIAKLAQCVPVKATDVDGMVEFARQNSIDFVVVAPDDPLALGMVDALQAAGIRAFGPTKQAARIESSKIFSKSLMKKYAIPTARWEAFTQLEPALDYVRRQGAPIVVKADGLALGKGVVVAQTVGEALDAVRDMMEGGKFFEAGRRVVIEEYLSGPEVTVLAFCDGKTLLPMPASRDHKRALDADMGPNTGGMGAICPVSDYGEALSARCMETIFRPTVDALQAEGCPFQGILYFGLMLTPDGPSVIEYNARFGDPEAQVVLTLLESDLMEIFLAVEAGSLDSVDVRWSSRHAACVVMASGGYPGAYETGKPISGLDALPGGVCAYHAGTALQDGRTVTAGGRVLGLTAAADSLSGALKLAYLGVDAVSFEGAHFRTDIGKRG